MALALGVEGREVVLVVAIGGGDDFRRGVSSTVLRAFVCAGVVGVWVWVDGVLARVVASFVGAVGPVDRVEEVVERCAFDYVADLVY